MTLTQERTLVLNHEQISRKIQRIAYEVVEQNFSEKEFYVIGITGQGYTLAGRLAEHIGKISGKPVHLHHITLEKDNPLQGKVEISVPVEELDGKYLLMVDDVLNSGRTLAYAVKTILRASVKKMQTACLIDRRHRRFPIRADYVGITLSTTLQDHIQVELNGKDDKAFLE